MKTLIERRIQELKKADEKACEQRWDMKRSRLERMAFRDQSNEITFARQELERIAQAIPSKEERLKAVLADPFWKFDLKELICLHVYERYIKQYAWSEFQIWSLFDIELLETLLFIRKELNRAITINDWHIGGRYDERGIRCNLCDLVASKEVAYLSAHPFAEGLDFDVAGMTAEEVRLWLEANADKLPYPIRVEDGKPWVHLDMRYFRPSGYEDVKVYRLTV